MRTSQLIGYLKGRERAVAVLAFTQVLTWGILIYPPVLIVRHIAAARDWSLAFGMSGFSLALVTSGLCSPYVGAMIDRHGSNRVMGIGALVGAAGLALMPLADHRIAYYGCWMLLGVAMSASLYDAAFTTLTRVFGVGARRQITLVTFAGGFASTVCWPATHLLIESIGWRGTYVVFALVFALVIAPLHGLALPRTAAPPPSPIVAVPGERMVAFLLPRGWPFLLLVGAFSLHSLVLSGVTSNLLAMFEGAGMDAATVVFIGALFGPAQVMARMADFIFAGRISPLWTGRIAATAVVIAFGALIVFGISPLTATLFAVVFGAANGVVTIVRGALPLAMFGSLGYGSVMGRIARPAALTQAMAPMLVAWSIEQFSDHAVLVAGAGLALLVLVCFIATKPPPTAT